MVSKTYAYNGGSLFLFLFTGDPNNPFSSVLPHSVPQAKDCGKHKLIQADLIFTFLHIKYSVWQAISIKPATLEPEENNHVKI